MKRSLVVLTISGLIIGGFAQTSQAAQSHRSAKSASVFATYQCGSDVTIHSTALTAGGAKSICTTLETTRQGFFDVFNGGQPMQNAPGDRTTGVDLYVFRDNAEYVANATALDYSVSRDPEANAGIMTEHDARKPNNHTQLVVRAFGGDVSKPLNLQHEFIHYLDFRYNIGADYDSSIWWSEGIAQTLGNPDSYDDSVDAVRTADYSLSEIIANDSVDDQDLVYAGGQLATEYFLTERGDDLNTLLDALLDGDGDAYQQWVDSIGSNLDGDFQAWLDAQ